MRCLQGYWTTEVLDYEYKGGEVRALPGTNARVGRLEDEGMEVGGGQAVWKGE